MVRASSPSSAGWRGGAACSGAPRRVCWPPRSPPHFESGSEPGADGGREGTRLRSSSPLPSRLLESLAQRSYVVRLYGADGRKLGSLPILR
jgi:hypothetical protein